MQIKRHLMFLIIFFSQFTYSINEIEWNELIKEEKYFLKNSEKVFFKFFLFYKD